MATHNGRMLGRTPTRAFCHCCNDLLEPKNVARRREERLWKREAEQEILEMPMSEVATNSSPAVVHD